ELVTFLLIDGHLAEVEHPFSRRRLGERGFSADGRRWLDFFLRIFRLFPGCFVLLGTVLLGLSRARFPNKGCSFRLLDPRRIPREPNRSRQGPQAENYGENHTEHPHVACSWGKAPRSTDSRDDLVGMDLHPMKIDGIKSSSIRR